MLFSGFDDGGWWLVVLGYWGIGSEVTRAGWKLAEKHHIAEGGAGRVGERKEREKMCFGLSCVFD